MANKAAKKLKQTNDQALQRLILGTIVAILIYGAGSFFLGLSGWVLPLLNVCFSGLALLQLAATVKAEQDVNLDGSLAKYMQDVVVVGWIGLIGGLFSPWVNLIWVVAIVYVAWLFLGPQSKKA
eukprot:m.3626 g.3626  ORF g.3626 m.3626 type:complete len:124 (+) comp6226_c0_seq1:61-432(+)